METENGAAGSSSQMMANAHGHFSASMAVAPPCPQMSQLHTTAEHAHYYYHQHSAFGAASGGAATQQQAPCSTPVHGAGLPAGDSCRFASPPMPPAAANPEAPQQAPATAADGAGQEKPVTSGTRARRVLRRRRPLRARRRSSKAPPRRSRRTISLRTVLRQRRRQRRPRRRRPPKSTTTGQGCRTGISTSRRSTIPASCSRWRSSWGSTMEPHHLVATSLLWGKAKSQSTIDQDLVFLIILAWF